jgi:hypothetical protein
MRAATDSGGKGFVVCAKQSECPVHVALDDDDVRDTVLIAIVSFTRCWCGRSLPKR